MDKNDKEEKMKKLFYSIPPNVFFILAILYLVFSGLSTTKAIIVENKVAEIFLRTLMEKDVLIAIYDSFTYVFSEAVLPLLPFLLLSGSAFLIFFLFKEEIGYQFFAIQIILLFLAFFLSSFSLIVLFLCLGIFVSSLFLFKGFEIRKTNFSTGDSLISKHLHLIVIFIAVGLFLNSYLKFEAYRQTSFQASFAFIQTLIPEISKIGEKFREYELTYVNESCEAIKSGLNESYKVFPQQTKEACKDVHESAIFVVENYKQEAISRIEAENMTSEEKTQEYVKQYFPVIEEATKVTPLSLLISFYILGKILTFFVALFFGVLYSGIKKFERKGVKTKK